MDFRDLIVFHDGAYVRYSDVNIGLMNHSFLYGTACFEAVRAYRTDDGEELRVLAALEHLRRLEQSANILRMKLPCSVEQLDEAIREVARRNDFHQDLYIRISLFKSAEQLGVRLHDIQDSVAIVAFPFAGGYYGGAAGIDVCVSAWRRIEDNAAPARAKISGTYVNSALAKSDAMIAGFDEALTLTEEGHVAEASAANVFILKGRNLITPPVNDNILEGITRRMVLMVAQSHLGLTALERSIDRSELYTADEIFICGTAVGITPVVSVDRRDIASRRVGEITSALIDTFNADVRRHEPILHQFLHPVYKAPKLRVAHLVS